MRVIRTLPVILTACGLLFSACAAKPPLQEMSEARSALSMAHEYDVQDPKLQQRLDAAQEALDEATQAMEKKDFLQAKRMAVQVKRDANSVLRELSQH